MTPAAFKLQRPRRARPPELGIRKAILEDLQYRALAARRSGLPYVEVWEQNAGAGIRIGAGGKPRPVRFTSENGIGDITGAIAPWGTHIEIEVKVPGGKLRATQIEHEEKMLRAGAIFFVATSVNDAVRQLDAVFAALRARWPI